MSVARGAHRRRRGEPWSLAVLMRYVRVDGECWLWTGWIDRGGYGRVSNSNKTRPAHRLAYEVLVGPIPEGLHLDHLCRNRACVNPGHLEPVTPAQNIARGAKAKQSCCLRGHEFTAENTYWVHFGTKTWRRCRACRRVREATPKPTQEEGKRCTDTWWWPV